MVIIKLCGGLGNQMFQYAVGRAITYRYDMKLKLDISAYRNDPIRTYRLKYLNIIENFATKEDIKSLIPGKKQITRWIAYQYKKRFYPFYRRPIIIERGNSTLFDPEILKIKNSTYLIGYWQSEKYFVDIAEIIRKEFSLRNKMNEHNEKIYNEILSENGISLHIRRGDYATNPEALKNHGILALDYYYNAMRIIEEKVKNPIIYVFSDDITWVKNNLKINLPLRFMDHKGSELDYEVLHLISACKHHIIANSSFSWWGAWLSIYPSKIVIVPEQWFSIKEMERRRDMDIIPDNWIKL
jgi:hypothetical protein